MQDKIVIEDLSENNFASQFLQSQVYGKSRVDEQIVNFLCELLIIEVNDLPTLLKNRLAHALYPFGGEIDINKGETEGHISEEMQFLYLSVGSASDALGIGAGLL